MRKMALLGISLIAVIAVLGLIAATAGAINRNKYEWCHADHTCYGIVGIVRTSKTWVYRIGGNEEVGGTYHKSHGVWSFHYEDGKEDGCELRMKKKNRHSLVGAEFCGASEIEAVELRRL